MLSKSVVQAFLNEPVENHDWIKECTEYEIYDSLEQEKPRFKLKPFLHQLQCFYLGYAFEQFLFLLKMGTGKTKLVLDILSYRGIGNILILCPNDSSMYTWGAEIAKHSDLSYTLLRGSSKEKYAALITTKSGIVVLTYPGMVALFKRFEKAISFIADHFGAIVYDEIHHAKNPDSSTFACCRYLSERIPIRYGLTGTAFGRNPMDVWAQYYLIDHGNTFSTNFYLFRAIFFDAYPVKNKKWVNYRFHNQYMRIFRRKLKNISISYTLDECELNLPERVDDIVYFRLSDFSANNYRNLLHRMGDAQGDYLQVKNYFMATRHVLSGRFRDYSTGEDLVDPDNNRLNALLALLESIDPEESIVIFCEFIPSGDVICAELAKLKIKFSKLYGEGIDHATALSDFINRKTRVIVANPRSGGVGLNFQISRYAIFYESPVSAILRQQAEARVYRSGQQKTTYIVDIAAQNTLDEKILSFGREGKNLLKYLVDGKI